MPELKPQGHGRRALQPQPLVLPQPGPDRKAHPGSRSSGSAGDQGGKHRQAVEDHPKDHGVPGKSLEGSSMTTGPRGVRSTRPAARPYAQTHGPEPSWMNHTLSAASASAGEEGRRGVGSCHPRVSRGWCSRPVAACPEWTALPCGQGTWLHGSGPAMPQRDDRVRARRTLWGPGSSPRVRPGHPAAHAAPGAQAGRGREAGGQATPAARAHSGPPMQSLCSRPMVLHSLSVCSPFPEF